MQVGTALLCTPEAATSEPHRRALLEHRYADTVITRAFSGRWARGLANRFAREHPDAPGGYPQVHHLTRRLRAAATSAGDPEVPNLWAGTGWRGAGGPRNCRRPRPTRRPAISGSTAPTWSATAR